MVLRSVREMACILQIWTGVLVGSRRSSISSEEREGLATGDWPLGEEGAGEKGVSLGESWWVCLGCGCAVRGWSDDWPHCAGDGEYGHPEGSLCEWTGGTLAAVAVGCSSVIMRMACAPWWLDGLGAKTHALYKGGGGTGLCAQSRSVSGCLLAAKVLWGLG